MPVMRKAIYLAIFLGLGACAHTNEQWFFVRGASMEQLSRHQALEKSFASKAPQPLGYDAREFVVTGHRLKDGDGVVFAFRSYGSGMLVDSASFLKITIFFPQSKFNAGVEIKIPDADGTMAYYSTSSSNFPGAGGCFGYASRGSIRVDSLSDSNITVTMDLQFRLASPLGSSGECGDKRVHGVYVIPQLRLQELNPWQGVAGKTLYDETIAP
jgi:hypothetical protein